MTPPSSVLHALCRSCRGELVRRTRMFSQILAEAVSSFTANDVVYLLEPALLGTTLVVLS